jgi:zinc transporter ZupT
MLYLLPFLSVILGYLIAIFLQPKNKTNLKLLLAFSGAFLLSITVIHLLPEIYESQNKYIGIFIMVGILFQIVLEFFSKGAEHGHVHGHDKLTQIPVGHHHDLAIGIAIHHFPIAIILTSFFLSAQLSKIALLVFMLSFAIMTPLGTFISGSFPILNEYYSQISAVVIGILFHISSTIIFESSEGHKFNIAKISMIILGIGLACFL